MPLPRATALSKLVLLLLAGGLALGSVTAAFGQSTESDPTVRESPDDAPEARNASSDVPNIVWFIVEDMSPDLGVYGNEVVRTPNLDRFARSGLRFTRAFAAHPQCSPNRSALATGMYATSIDAQHHRSHRNDGYTLPAGVRVISDWLRPAVRSGQDLAVRCGSPCSASRPVARGA